VGWDVWCVPQASVIHYEAQSSQQTRWRSYVVKWQSRYRFFAAHYPPWWQAANRLLVRLGTWAEARRARQDCERRVITETELEERLTAFRQVAAL
jgi:GT2 family glycosyltransferase